jgi:hypothetical protein
VLSVSPSRSPVTDLVVVLREGDQSPGRERQVQRSPVRVFAEGRVCAVVEVPRSRGLGERTERREVGVVAGRVSGQRDVKRVVIVIAPLRGESVAAGIERTDEGVVVQVRLGDEREWAV